MELTPAHQATSVRIPLPKERCEALHLLIHQSAKRGERATCERRACVGVIVADLEGRTS